MPILEIKNLPKSTSDGDILRLRVELINAVRSVESLHLLRDEDVTCLFYGNLLQNSQDRCIILDVRGLFQKPWRTLEVRRNLAEALGCVVRKQFTGSKVEVILEPFDQNHEAYWSSTPPTEHSAVTILGAYKVITYEQSYTAMQQKPKLGQQRIRYSEETLRERALENLTYHKDWRLVYSHPLSFETLAELFSDPAERPYVRNHEWLEGGNGHDWVSAQPEEGYYLIDFAKMHTCRPWYYQQATIESYGSEYERADERVLAQALLSLSIVHGQHLFRDLRHWGNLATPTGNHVTVGNFEDRVLEITVELSDSRAEQLGACISLKREF